MNLVSFLAGAATASVVVMIVSRFWFWLSMRRLRRRLAAAPLAWQDENHHWDGDGLDAFYRQAIRQRERDRMERKASRSV